MPLFAGFIQAVKGICVETCPLAIVAQDKDAALSIGLKRAQAHMPAADGYIQHMTDVFEVTAGLLALLETQDVPADRPA